MAWLLYRPVMRFLVGIVCLSLGCAGTRAAGRASADGPVTLDPIEPVAAYLEDSAPLSGADPARLRIEVLEIAVLPTRPDGVRWDGGLLPDDAVQAQVTEALAAPDAARRAPKLLRGFTRPSAPDLRGELTVVAGGATVASAPLPAMTDVTVRPGAALDPVPLAADTALRIQLIDDDPSDSDRVGDVTIDRDALLDALRAGGPAVLDLRGSGTGGIMFVTLKVTAA
jgi:hypothetical protein